MNRSQQKYSKKHSAGFSLIEFLVASVLSMIVLIAIGSGYFAARKINDVALGRLGVQQDMRNAANLIVRDARMAGSFGCFNMANKEPATVGSDGSASSNTPRNLIAAGQTTGLVPVKSFAGSTFNVTGFTASGDALVFQYGIGSASITGNNNGTMTMQMPADDPLQNISSNMPLVFSSCNVIDRPTSFTATRSGRPCAAQRVCQRQAWSSMLRVSCSIRPACSSAGMNCEGQTISPSARRQRASASTVITRPLSTVTWGWK